MQQQKEHDRRGKEKRVDSDDKNGKQLSFAQQRTRFRRKFVDDHGNTVIDGPQQAGATAISRAGRPTATDTNGALGQRRRNGQKRRRPRKTDAMPITGYDAEAIEAFYDTRPLQVGWRLNSLGFPLLGKFSYMRTFPSVSLIL